jgi:hypothetical protein
MMHVQCVTKTTNWPQSMLWGIRDVTDAILKEMSQGSMGILNRPV